MCVGLQKKNRLFGAYAVGAADGKLLWSFSTATVVSLPAIGTDGRIVLLACNDTKLYAIDASTAKQSWAVSTVGVPTHPVSSPDSETVYLVSSGFELKALNAATGALRWTVTPRTAAGAVTVLSVPISSPGGDTVFVVGAGSDSSNLFAYASSDGSPRWVAHGEIGAVGRWHAAFDQFGGALYTASSNAALTAFAPHDGSKFWSRIVQESGAATKLEPRLFAVNTVPLFALDVPVVFLASTGGQLCAISIPRYHPSPDVSGGNSHGWQLGFVLSWVGLTAVMVVAVAWRFRKRTEAVGHTTLLGAESIQHRYGS